MLQKHTQMSNIYNTAETQMWYGHSHFPLTQASQILKLEEDITQDNTVAYSELEKHSGFNI